jgi:hypothetical protein
MLSRDFINCSMFTTRCGAVTVVQSRNQQYTHQQKITNDLMINNMLANESTYRQATIWGCNHERGKGRPISAESGSSSKHGAGLHCKTATGTFEASPANHARLRTKADRTHVPGRALLEACSCRQAASISLRSNAHTYAAILTSAPRSGTNLESGRA